MFQKSPKSLQIVGLLICKEMCHQKLSIAAQSGHTDDDDDDDGDVGKRVFFTKEQSPTRTATNKMLSKRIKRKELFIAVSVFRFITFDAIFTYLVERNILNATFLHLFVLEYIHYHL